MPFHLFWSRGGSGTLEPLIVTSFRSPRYLSWPHIGPVLYRLVAASRGPSRVFQHGIFHLYRLFRHFFDAALLCSPAGHT